MNILAICQKLKKIVAQVYRTIQNYLQDCQVKFTAIYAVLELAWPNIIPLLSTISNFQDTCNFLFPP